MSRFSRWREDRFYRDEDAVIKAIRMLKPSQAFREPIACLAYLGRRRAGRALSRLELADVITSAWSDGPHPRRCLYRLAPAAAPAWAP